MTTIVTIAACCGDAKEVHVVVTDAGSLVEDFHIANGEKAERYAYDDRVITVQEVAKVDRHALEVEAAEFSLRQATLRYEDAASRGFPLGNEVQLKADVVAKHGALDALTPPAPAADNFSMVAVPQPALETKTYSDTAFGVNATIKPDELEKNQRTRAMLDAMTDPAVEAITETKTYADGTTALGIGPLPDQSPAEQEAAESGALPAESKAFLDSLDPAPMISDGTTDSVEGPTES